MPTPPPRNRYRRPVSYVICFAALTAISLSLGACDRRSPAPASATLTLIGPGPGDPRWGAVVAGARKWAADYPWLKVVAMNPIEGGEAAFRNAVFEAVRGRPTVACVWLPNPDWINIGTFINANVTLITIGERIDDGRVAGEIELDLPAAAERLGGAIGGLAEGGRSYILLHEAERTPQSAALLEHFSWGVRSVADMFQLDSVDLSRSAKSPIDSVRVHRELFPNVALFVSLTPAPWLTATPEEALGPTARFATLGGGPRFWKHIRRGRCAGMMAHIDADIGKLASELAVAAITAPQAAQLRRTVQSELVTRDNLDDFAKRYADALGISPAECEGM